MELLLFGIGILCIFLLTQRWFWVLAFSLGTLAALFTSIASIIHFQIFGAVGFFVLFLILASITSSF